jgi:hypothetical protein
MPTGRRRSIPICRGCLEPATRRRISSQGWGLRADAGVAANSFSSETNGTRRIQMHFSLAWTQGAILLVRRSGADPANMISSRGRQAAPGLSHLRNCLLYSARTCAITVRFLVSKMWLKCAPLYLEIDPPADNLVREPHDPQRSSSTASTSARSSSSSASTSAASAQSSAAGTTKAPGYPQRL